MQVVNTHQAKTHLSKLLAEVSQGKEVIIGKAGIPVAKLISFRAPRKNRTGGQLKGKISMAKDFDTLPKDFVEYFTG